MDQDIQTQIKNRFAELPPKIQEAITESDWRIPMRRIIKEANLRIDQGGAVEMETLLTMLGLASPEEYLDNLIAEAQIDRTTATNISLKIEQEIFKKIRDILIEDDEKENNVVEELLKDAAKKGGEFVKPMIPAAQVPVPPKTNYNPDRDTLLKEIEDHDETELMIPSVPQSPSTQVNTTEQNQKIISQDLSTTNQNTVAQKLQTPTVSAPTTLKIDPYRELPE